MVAEGEALVVWKVWQQSDRTRKLRIPILNNGPKAEGEGSYPEQWAQGRSELEVCEAFHAWSSSTVAHFLQQGCATATFSSCATN